MNKVFEDDFLDVQSRIIALCVEFADNKADKVYAYGSIEENSISFNAFFNIGGQIKTTNNVVTDTDTTVSYTHLDVYKRQVNGITNQEMLCVIHSNKPKVENGIY